MTSAGSFYYEQRTVTYPDGDWAEVCAVGIPADALRFADITLADHRVRLRDAARLRYYKAQRRGESAPAIIAWACLEVDQPASEVFPSIETSTSEGERLLSANSFVTYTLRALLARGWLHWRDHTWHVETPDQGWRARGRAVLDWLGAADRLWLETGPTPPQPAYHFARFDPLLNLIPVGRCGYVRDTARARLPRVAFNSTYFLLEHEDFLSHHSALGDPYGLLVVDGLIHRPPLYRRSAIWRGADGRWQVGHLGMADVSLHLPGGLAAQPAINPAAPGDVALYTRYFGVAQQGKVLGYTPPAPGRLELTIIDRQIVGWQRGGKLQLPQNGYALSFAPGVLSATQQESLLAFAPLTYTFSQPEHAGISQAVGCGPLLLKAGQATLSADTLAGEQFWISRRGIVGVVPTEYPDDVDRSRAARAGLGITAQGDLVLVAVSGTSKDLARNDNLSAGATLVELAEQLLAAGAVEAVNLDGGGSVQVFVEGGLFNQPGDQRGRPGVFYERMVPTIGLSS